MYSDIYVLKIDFLCFSRRDSRRVEYKNVHVLLFLPEKFEPNEILFNFINKFLGQKELIL